MRFKTLRFIGCLVVVVSGVCASACGQGKPVQRTFEADGYSITYRDDWVVSRDGAIVNIYPKDDKGAVTISTYDGITFPLDLTRDFILELNGISDTADKVKMTSRGDVVEFGHEYLDKKANARWITKAFRKGDSLFLITVNCDDKHWPSRKNDFLAVLSSFKVRGK